MQCFREYDVRGVYPDELNEYIAYALGVAAADVFGVRTAVIGRDPRLSGLKLQNALASGLIDSGARVCVIGLCGTEEIYYAAAKEGFDLGVMITASHNPGHENGLKFIKGGAIPVGRNTGLSRLYALANSLRIKSNQNMTPQTLESQSFRDKYIKHILTLSGLATIQKNFKPLHILVDAGNGCAGLILSQLKRFLPFDFIEENYTPDGNFPNGVPNPLLPERRAYTSRRVVESGADLGVAFDGDFDRCFFYDRKGNFLDSYYLVGILAAEMLALHPGEKIIHDPRVYWNTRELVLNAGGIPVMAKTGHVFIKEAMRRENALYGGEMSGHHYFRDFSFCDSGMLTMLMVLKNLVGSSQDLEEIIYKMRLRWPNSGEINFRVEDPDFIISQVWDTYLNNSVFQDKIDGINMEFKDWRFNLRKSNTENLLRLNVESRGDPDLLQEKTEELQAFCQKLI